MKTSNFEGVKVALKQDKTGYVLTLSIHPDDVPDEILRDFVGSRYQVVMVRLNSQEQPMNRDRDLPKDVVQFLVIDSYVDHFIPQFANFRYSSATVRSSITFSHRSSPSGKARVCSL